ncbi:MAG TPA: HIT domain-containing protein [Vicinamibacterales bacterium]|nr:HIT domain-containing protein [Vicinamibacterales bacterium]
MHRLWTPWRLAYLTDTTSPAPGCIFCAALAGPEMDPLVVYRAGRAYVILNKFPYNNGHLMVVPQRHTGRLADLDAAELAELMELAQLSERVLGTLYGPHGFNMGLNLGTAAGAGIADHLHMHVVPRWNGDTNFVSVVGETRVLPEELPATAGRLRTAFASIAGQSR